MRIPGSEGCAGSWVAATSSAARRARAVRYGMDASRGTGRLTADRILSRGHAPAGGRPRRVSAPPPRRAKRALLERDLDEPPCREPPLEAAPDLERDVLGGRDAGAERRDVEVQVLVVERRDDLVLDDAVHGDEVGDAPCLRIGVPLDDHRDAEVVAMAVRVRRRTEDAQVLARAPVLAEEAVRCAEPVRPAELDHRTGSYQEQVGGLVG